MTEYIFIFFGFSFFFSFVISRSIALQFLHIIKTCKIKRIHVFFFGFGLHIIYVNETMIFVFVRFVNDQNKKLDECCYSTIIILYYK